MAECPKIGDDRLDKPLPLSKLFVLSAKATAVTAEGAEQIKQKMTQLKNVYFGK